MSIPWLDLARRELGTLEIKGDRDNPRIVAYFADAGFSGVKDDETAWCAAFVGAILKRAGVAPSASLAARSYEKWGVPLAAPALGCIGVKSRRGGAAWQGHVGFVVAASQASVWLLGGNQSDSVSIAAFRRDEFTAYRWPTGVPRVVAVLPNSAAGAAGAREA